MCLCLLGQRAKDQVSWFAPMYRLEGSLGIQLRNEADEKWMRRRLNRPEDCRAHDACNECILSHVFERNCGSQLRNKLAILLLLPPRTSQRSPKTSQKAQGLMLHVNLTRCSAMKSVQSTLTAPE